MRVAVLLAALLAISFETGFCLVDTVIPEPGSIVVGRENQNIMLFCELTLGGNLQSTSWHIGEEGVPVDDAQQITTLNPDYIITGDPLDPLAPNSTLTFGTNLTIVSLTADLDGMVIFCGRAGLLDAAEFTLRIYRPPSLLDDVMSRPIEFTSDTVTVRGTPEAYPTPPQFYQWTKDGADLSDSENITLEYANVTFTSVRREDAGTYVLTARNYECEEWALAPPPNSTCTQSSVVIGSDTGTFVLDVLFGPGIDVEQDTFGAFVGESATLVCGSNPTGNPTPDIVWRDNNGIVVNETDPRYTVSGDRLMLTITGVTAADEGDWQCVLTVEDDGTIIGSPLTELRTLVVASPPGPPFELIVMNEEATSIQLCWEPPLDTGSSGIDIYRIFFGDRIVNTTDNVTDFTVPDLLPNTMYNFTVAAISSFLGVSLVGPQSNEASGTTLTTVPAPVCSSAPVSSNGVIIVEWSYTHTGGLDLTQVTVQYRSLPGGELTIPPNGDVNNPAASFTTITVENLLAGEEYEFRVTARNADGPTTVTCPPVTHSMGVPPAPATPTGSSSSPGQATLALSTNEAGTAPGEAIDFIVTASRVSDDVTPSRQTDDEIEQTRSYPNYVDGSTVMFDFIDLEGGENYVFSAVVRNSFGRSQPSGNSAAITVQEEDAPSSNTGAIVGGVIGGLIGLVLLILIILIVVYILLRCRGGGSYSVERGGPKVEEVDVEVDIGTELKNTTNTNTNNDKKAELHYAELETFKTFKKTPLEQESGEGELDVVVSPQPSEEPVQYATIDVSISHREKEVAEAAVPEPQEDLAGESTATFV